MKQYQPTFDKQKYFNEVKELKTIVKNKFGKYFSFVHTFTEPRLSTGYRTKWFDCNNAVEIVEFINKKCTGNLKAGIVLGNQYSVLITPKDWQLHYNLNSVSEVKPSVKPKTRKVTKKEVVIKELEVEYKELFQVNNKTFSVYTIPETSKKVININNDEFPIEEIIALGKALEKNCKN